MRRPVILGAIVLALASPAVAGGPIPVVDVTSNKTQYAHLIKTAEELRQTIQLVSAAKANLTALGSGVGVLGVANRITRISQALNQAQAACRVAIQGKTMPSACNVQANTATAQAAQLGSDLGQIESIQAAARGSGGALAATQAAATASLVVASQLQQMRQAQIAADIQKEIDANALAAAKQKATINPWGQ